MAVSIELLPLAPEQHLEFLNKQSAPGTPYVQSVSFLQTPAWAACKPDWTSEAIGFYKNSQLIGAGLILYRQMPKLKKYLAYLPEGPVIDWTSEDVPEILAALKAHVKKKGSFALRIGPTLIAQRWYDATIKKAAADEAITHLSQVPADETYAAGTRLANQLQHLGWLPPRTAKGFGDGQPKYNIQLSLVNRDENQVATAAKTEAEVLAGMNQQWRRNIKKSDKSGVEVTQEGRAEIPTLHEVYVETAERDHFTGRSLKYFETMYDALTAEDPSREKVYLARHEGDVVAANATVILGRHAWYAYGASTTAKRDVRGSNAIQWHVIRECMKAGVEVYDLRGVTGGLHPDDPELGLTQFKVGTGADAIAYLGEWDMPINPLLYKGFMMYMERRR